MENNKEMRDLYYAVYRVRMSEREILGSTIFESGSLQQFQYPSLTPEVTCLILGNRDMNCVEKLKEYIL